MGAIQEELFEDEQVENEENPKTDIARSKSEIMKRW